MVGEVSRRELVEAADPTVAIFPSREDGIPFCEENNAWGFVRIGQNPEYTGLSITGGGGAVMYVARMKEIVPASDATLSRSLASSTGDQALVDQNTRVGVFEPEPSYESSDPILLATRVPYGLRETDLESFWTAASQTISFERATLSFSELVWFGS